MALTLSSWHVILGWADLITDIISVISTRRLATLAQYRREICGVTMSNYFQVCFIIQLALLSANLLAQSILAAKNAMTGPGQPRRAKSVLVAALRGLLNLELAYQEWWKKRSAEDYSQEAMQRHTTAVLYYKLTELVFEAPQVLLSWTVLLLRVTADYMLKLSPEQSPAQVSSETDSAVWLWVFTMGCIPPFCPSKCPQSWLTLRVQTP